MKRLVEVAGNEELLRAIELQQEYRDSKRKLEKTAKSLRNYKGINKDTKIQLDKFVVDLQSVLRFKPDKVPKRSVLDYYSILTEDMLTGVVSHIKFLSQACGTTITKARQLKQNAIKTLEETDKIFLEKTESHEKMVKDYVETVYPQTKGLLFKLHLKSGQGMPKKGDQAKQDQMLKEVTVYNSLLEDCINTYEDLRRQLEECGENGLYNFRDTWIKSSQEMNNELAKVEVSEDELNIFVEGLPKNNNDRERSRSREKSKSKGKPNRSTH